MGLTTFVLGTTQPNIIAAISGISEGSFGFTADYTSTVTQVEPGLPAAQAGIAPGDVIEPVSFVDRVSLFESVVSVPGTAARVVVRRGTAERSLTLRSVAVSEAGTLIVTVIKRLTALAFVLVGATLILLRPSRMTWGLFLFALSSNGTAGALYFRIFGLGVYLPIALSLSIIYSIGALGLWIFAARFPNDDAPGWRGWFDRAAPWLAIPMLAANAPYWRYLFTGQHTDLVGYWYSTYFPVAVESVGILILVATYLHERGEARQRIKWVVAGFAVGYLTDGAITLLSDPNVHLWPVAWMSYITPDILYAGWVAAPLTIAYAVLRHRVIDVRFAVSRAIVYAVLTSLVVAAFALIDWIFTKKLSVARLGTVAEIGTAIAIGFWFNTLHRRIDFFVDGVLFRRRHLSEKRLALAASALPHAASLQAAAELLTAEPVHAFELTSGATFMRTEDESFHRIFALGWEGPFTDRLPHDDLLIARLRAAADALALHGLYWPTVQQCPAGHAAPTLALPVFIRNQLAAIVLFGPHESGEAFDPDELRSLHALCIGASTAFDHLEAELRRVENESLRKVIEQLGSRGAVAMPNIATA